ncbi:hypothetical protein SS50377_24913 [Spironucleus salmonicida]|uniref:Uncharacterized protein n=1 Tax=Spironucleus salmonicida TaxID=348837 RepID=V6LRN5_9EUKA|nr:hypothetical protein SS50377_24910 [Spironucleus salmonicida]KAH0572800.1 hypothetical protein SS50377_24913 [Spironucleus salmonicida]|eukprot:EST43442.1 Hypothetical protein SS50377_16804 [Spironucleus salmonicida]
MKTRPSQIQSSKTHSLHNLLARRTIKEQIPPESPCQHFQQAFPLKNIGTDNQTLELSSDIFEKDETILAQKMIIDFSLLELQL